MTVRGSSPLARGLLDHRQQRDDRSGIIPARAGFTPRLPKSGKRSPDHPRSRGVYTWTRSRPSTRLGSSPLARGLPARISSNLIYSGIIPARAGFTRRVPHLERPDADHPRSRGVYSRAASRAASAAWIIPARAGFTRARDHRGRTMEDHPRSRGVYHSRQGTGPPAQGSSPLARGLLGRNLR